MARSYSRVSDVFLRVLLNGMSYNYKQEKRVSDVFLRVLLNTPNHHITLHTDV